jgi:hypothetical protein
LRATICALVEGLLAVVVAVQAGFATAAAQQEDAPLVSRLSASESK